MLSRRSLFLYIKFYGSQPIGFDNALGHLFLSEGIGLVMVDDIGAADVVIVDRKKELPSFARGHGNAQDWPKLKPGVLYIIYRAEIAKTVYPELVKRVNSLDWKTLIPLVKGFLGQKEDASN